MYIFDLVMRRTLADWELTRQYQISALSPTEKQNRATIVSSFFIEPYPEKHSFHIVQ